MVRIVSEDFAKYKDEFKSNKSILIINYFRFKFSVSFDKIENMNEKTIEPIFRNIGASILGLRRNGFEYKI